MGKWERKCVGTRLSEHAGQHELEMKVGGVLVRHRRWEQGRKTTDNVESTGSAGETRGVLRFDFWISCWQRKLYLSGATKLLGPALDELAPADCTVTWSFTDHHFTGLDMWVFHPSPAGGWILSG